MSKQMNPECPARFSALREGEKRPLLVGRQAVVATAPYLSCLMYGVFDELSPYYSHQREMRIAWFQYQ